MWRNGVIRALVLCLNGLLVTISGCGGGSSISTPPPPPPPSFSISAAPSQVTLLPNSTAPVSLTLTTNATFSGSVAVSLSGLPSGVTAAPSSPFSLPTSGLSVNLAADASVSPGSYTLNFNATSGSLVSSAQVKLTISTSTASSGSNRTDFVATDDTPSSIVYDPAHNAIYAVLPLLGRVDVIDAATHQILKEMPVPGSGGNGLGSGLSLTPDGKRILISGVPQQMAWIDTTSQKVSQFQILPQFQDSCCPLSPAEPGKPMVLSNGNVLLLGQNPISRGIMEWRPSAGQLVGINPDPKYSVFFPQGTIGARSADGTKAVFSSDTLPSDVAIFDAASDSFVAVSHANSFVFSVAANPTGTQFALAINLAGVSIVDSNLNAVGQVAAGGTLYGMVYSPDGKKLYIVHMPENVPLISTFDTSTFKLLGQAPAYATELAYIQRVPPFFVESPMATDGTGLLFGAGDHGVAVDDSTYFQNILPTAVPSTAAVIVNPGEGPQKSVTSVSIATQVTNSPPSVWFGALAGVNSSVNSSGLVQASAPSSPSVGPVNVKLLGADGTEGNVPNGFTYGVVPIGSPVLAAAPSGGVSADLFGFGFGSDVGSQVQAQIGGNAASIQKNALFPAEYIFGYPLPLDHVRVTVPAGSPGAADIMITSSAGSGKITGGMHYVQSVTEYPSADAFTFILYDAHRSNLYLSAGDHIDVFSVTSHTFLAPIVPPTLGGHAVMLGLALTPDGSKLLAANYADSSIAIINPDNPPSAQAVQIPQTTLGFEGPTQLVCSNVNHALIAVSSSSAGGVGSGLLFDVDLSTLVVKAVFGPFNTGVFDNFLASSRDGSKLAVGIPEEGVFVLDSATNSWSAGPPRNPFEVAASGDGNVFTSDTVAPPPSSATSLSFFDSAANLIGVTGLPEYLDATPALAGIKLNDPGSLAYVGVTWNIPIVSSTFAESLIDIYDVRHHELRERVLLADKFPPQETTQSGLAIDPAGENIFLITTTGLTTITLDSVPLSIGSVTPNSGAGGTKVTIRGSGFTQQTTATCNGIAVAVTFVDASTLSLTIPSSLASGAVSISLTNSAGSNYTLDAAFQVN